MSKLKLCPKCDTKGSPYLIGEWGYCADCFREYCKQYAEDA